MQLLYLEKPKQSRFPKVKWLHLAYEMDKSVRFSCQYYRNLTYKKSLKSVDFWRRYSKNETLDVFWRHCVHISRSINRWSYARSSYTLARISNSVRGSPGALDSDIYRSAQFCSVWPQNLKPTTHGTSISRTNTKFTPPASPTRPELFIGPFCLTQSNPTHQLTDPTQPNPLQLEKFGPNSTQPNTTNNGDYSFVVTHFYTPNLSVSGTCLWP